MNVTERIKMIKAMEMITRNLNAEDLMEPWLMVGVADGDIEYGDLTADESQFDEMEFYIEDESFAEIMGTFLRTMSRANKCGGLYCDNIVSK